MVPILLIRASFGSDETGSSLLKGLAKRSQHFNATSCNIVGHNMLHTFGHPVAICCNMLDDVGSNLKMVKFFTRLATFKQNCCTRACALGPLVARQWPGAQKHRHFALKMLKMLRAFGQPVQHMSQHHATICRFPLSTVLNHAESKLSRCCMNLKAFKLCFNNHSTFLLFSRMLNELEGVCPTLQHKGASATTTETETRTSQISIFSQSKKK